MSLATVDTPQNGNAPQPARVTPVNEPIDRNNVGAIQIRDREGGVSFANMIEVMDFAKLMAVSQTAVPKHLRGNPGACMAVCIQAIEWGMSPFAVANKSYSVNDRLAYESAIYHGVVSKRAPIKGRIRMSYSGSGDSRVCKVWATLADGTGEVDYESPAFGKIQPKNSPLWKNDPDQQLFYFSVRAWARRHFSDVMMGVYTVDEIQDAPEPVKIEEQPRGAAALLDKLKTGNQIAAPQVSPESLSQHAHPFVDEQTGEESQGEPQHEDSQEQPELPPVPDQKLDHEKFVDHVASMCGIEMGEAAQKLKLVFPKPEWKQATRPYQEKWWGEYLAGKKDGLKPKA